MAAAGAAGLDDRMLRILFLTTVYGPGQHAALIENLGRELSEAGHDVRVAGIDWNAPAGSPVKHYREAWGAEILLHPPAEGIGPGKVGRLLSKWFWSSRAALPDIRRRFGGVEYDLVFVMTPAVALAWLIGWARRISKRSYAYITDFFPFHHASIGLVPRGLPMRLALFAETRLFRTFDTLAVMSPMGETYLRARYTLAPDQHIQVLPLWTGTAAHTAPPPADVRRKFGLPLDKHIAVFGGQITDGKGIEDILAAAALARQSDPDILFLLIGKGRLEHLVQDYIAGGGSNVRLQPFLPSRTDFLDLISSCDMGLVATVPNVDVPTFPSKSLDYLAVGLPVVASVERTTDFGEFVKDRGFGLAFEAGNPADLLEAVRTISSDPERAELMGRAGARTLAEVFSARRAAADILRLPAQAPLA